jgi:hypothetical protein
MEIDGEILRMEIVFTTKPKLCSAAVACWEATNHKRRGFVLAELSGIWWRWKYLC